MAAMIWSFGMTTTWEKCSERSANRVAMNRHRRRAVLNNRPSCKNKHLMGDKLQVGCFSRPGAA